MMLFRKKPETIEAVQFLDRAKPPEGVTIGKDGIDWINTFGKGNQIVNLGDWIISDGMYYCSIKDEAFQAIYERYFPEFESNRFPKEGEMS